MSSGKSRRIFIIYSGIIMFELHKCVLFMALVFFTVKTESTITRQLRTNLRRIGAVAALSSLTLSTTPHVSADSLPSALNFPQGAQQVPPSLREGISSGAMMPGFGPKDVEYPIGFLGKWKVVQTITAVEDNRQKAQLTVPSVDAIIAKGPGDITFEREYVKDASGRVVLERASAKSNFEKALMGVTVVSQWNQDNPNVLTTTEFSGNGETPLLEEVKVTKRSQETSATTKEIDQSINLEAQMGYSEFSRVSVEKPDRDVSQVSTVPKVISQRLLARYKYDEGTPVTLTQSAIKVDKVVGVERLYIYTGDSLDIGKPRPDVVVKSKVTMSRLEE